MIVPQTAIGPTVPIPDTVDAHTFLFSSYFKELPNPHEKNGYSDHTFDGKVIPPARPFLVDTSTGATATFARIKSDSIKVAANLAKLVGPPSPFDSKANTKAVSTIGPVL